MKSPYAKSVTQCFRPSRTRLPRRFTWLAQPRPLWPYATAAAILPGAAKPGGSSRSSAKLPCKFPKTLTPSCGRFASTAKSGSGVCSATSTLLTRSMTAGFDESRPAKPAGRRCGPVQSPTPFAFAAAAAGACDRYEKDCSARQGGRTQEIYLPLPEIDGKSRKIAWPWTSRSRKLQPPAPFFIEQKGRKG
jgi:hypothetical protein